MIMKQAKSTTSMFSMKKLATAFVLLLTASLFIACGVPPQEDLGELKSQLSQASGPEYSYEYRNLPLPAFAQGQYQPGNNFLQTPTADGFEGWVYLFESRPAPTVFQQNPTLFPTPVILFPPPPQPNPAFGQPNPAPSAALGAPYFNSGVRVSAGQDALTLPLNRQRFSNAPPSELTVNDTNGTPVETAKLVAKILDSERFNPQQAPLLITTILRYTLFRWSKGQVVHTIVNNNDGNRYILFTTAASPINYQPQVDVTQVGALTASFAATPGFSNNWTYESCALKRQLLVFSGINGVKVASVLNPLQPVFQRLKPWQRVKCQ